jgi:pimeloyl-ACP methyl ester carboxylesterase
MNRRTFVRTTVAAAASSLLVGAVHAQAAPKAKNVVLIHGLFADGSCWSEVIPRLQAKGIQATAVQNPLTTLQAAVEATPQVLAWQQGPIVLVAHSFGGMILTEAGIDPKVSAVVYVAARAPDAGEDYTPLRASTLRRQPPTALFGRTIGADSVRKHFYAILPPTCRRTRRVSSMPSRLRSNGRCLRTKQLTRHGGRSRAGTPYPPKIGRSTRISSASWPSAWARKRSR